MHKVIHQVYATLEGNSLNQEILEQLPEISEVGRYKNAEIPGIRFPERALFYLQEPCNDYSDMDTILDRLEDHYPTMQAGGVRKIILRWTILSNNAAYEVNTELDRGYLLRLANINGSLAITFYAKTHL